MSAREPRFHSITPLPKKAASVPPDRIEVDPTMITNVRIGELEPPPGELWVTNLFTREIRGTKVSRVLVELAADTKDELDAEVVRFVEQPNVTLLERDFDYSRGGR